MNCTLICRWLAAGAAEYHIRGERLRYATPICFIERFHVLFGAATVRVPLVGQTLVETLNLAWRSIFTRAEDRIVIRFGIQDESPL
jgi:hypothetical protein